MKRILLIALAVSTVFQAKAQLFGPESLTGAALGGLIGGFAGGGNGHCGNSFSGNDAAIGAGIGLVAGALFGAVNRQNAYNSQYYDYAPEPYPQAQAYPVAAPSAPEPQPTPQVENNWPKHGPNNTTYYWTRPPASLLQN